MDRNISATYTKGGLLGRVGRPHTKGHEPENPALCTSGERPAHLVEVAGHRDYVSLEVGAQCVQHDLRNLIAKASLSCRDKCKASSLPKQQKLRADHN